jgi:hypothetical protein
MTTRILSSSFSQILNTNPETGNTIVEIAGGSSGGGGDASAANQVAVQADPGADASKVVAVQGVTGGKSIPVTFASPQAVTGTFWQTTQPVSTVQLPSSLGAKTVANSLSVTPASDAIFKGTTASASKLVTLVFTRVANTNNYAIDDQWGDLRQEAGFGMAGEGYWLTAINLVSSLATLPTGYGSFSLYIFNSSVNAGSGIADNDPFTRRPFAVQSGNGIVLNTSSKATNDATANSFTGNLREQIHLTGTDLWFRLVTRTAITSPVAAADTITLTLRFAGMS